MSDEKSPKVSKKTKKKVAKKVEAPKEVKAEKVLVGRNPHTGEDVYSSK